MVEISSHASPYIVAEILDLLVLYGCRYAEPGEFTKRAFLNGKMDLAQAEAVADVIASETEAAHRIALKQLKGGFSQELALMRRQMLKLVSLMELELDFSEEEVEFASRTQLMALLDETLERVDRLADSFRAGNAIKNGVPVAIVGGVNTGKSTLLNALVGEDRAIVSDEAGTTRDTVEERVMIGGVLFRFIDTAGLRKTAGTVEQMGISRSLDSLSKASVVLLVLDGSAPLPALRDSFPEVAGKIDLSNQILFVLRNKKDVCGGSWILSPASVAADLGVDRVLDISARTGEGLDELRCSLAEAWTERSMGAEDSVVVTNMRHYEALRRASGNLREVRSGLASGTSTDLLSQPLRLATRELGSIFGEITSDEILGEIFGRFCIGK